MASLASTSSLSTRVTAVPRHVRPPVTCSAAHPAAAKLLASSASATWGGSSSATAPLAARAASGRRGAPYRAVRAAVAAESKGEETEVKAEAAAAEVTAVAEEVKAVKEVKPVVKKVIAAVELKSEVDMDYAPLEEALKEGKFRAADDMTRALLIELAGTDSETREYVYFTEVKNIPVMDLKTIDALWVAYSDGKFGYSVQRKIWKQNKEQWGKFFKKLDWTTGENNSYRSWAGNEYIYSDEAAPGHLPLTSCLRGTQLLRGLLEHPAIAPPTTIGADGKVEEVSKGGVFSKPSWLKF